MIRRTSDSSGKTVQHQPSPIKLSVLTLVLGVFFSPGYAATTVESSPAAEVDHAAGLFLKNCLRCHVGATAGSDVHLQNSSTRTTESLKNSVIRMQQYTPVMTEEEIDSLVELLKDPLLLERLADAEDQSAPLNTGTSAVQLADSATLSSDTKSPTLSGAASNWALPQKAAAAPTSITTSETTDTALAALDIGAEFFNKSCAACHAIDGAKRTGPNLAGTSTWPDAQLEAAIRRMEKHVGPMENTQVKSLVELLHDARADERLQAAVASQKMKQAVNMEKPSIASGDQLFHGDLSLANGGVSCVACHAISGSGGSMGPDLTHVFTKLGEMGLRSACEQGNFKVMSAAYRNHKVTPQEAAHLTAYLETIDKTPPPARGSAVPLFGTVGAAAFLGLLGLIFAKHKGGTDRHKLQRRR